MNEITSMDEWRERWVEVWQAYFIFKHSTACPTSADVLDRVHVWLEGAGEDVPEFVLVKVIESSEISKWIGLNIGVEHASPQLILVMGSVGVWSVSHDEITGESIEDALDEFVWD